MDALITKEVVVPFRGVKTLSGIAGVFDVVLVIAGGGSCAPGGGQNANTDERSERVARAFEYIIALECAIALLISILYNAAT